MTHSIKGDYLRGGKHSARATTLPRNNILIGDVRDRLAELPTSSVDTIITSPPYFGVRNYGHDQQLGAEPDVDGWVEGLRDTAREFARVLRPTGSLWLNLGDSYARRPTEGAPVKRSFPLAGRFVVLGMTGLAERLVPDELWEFFRRVVPETVVIRPQGGGRQRAGDRECLAAIVFVATSGCTWRQVPPVFGPAWPTVYRRFARWSADRVWARLHRVILDELGARGELDWSRFAIDSVSVRALKGGS